MLNMDLLSFLGKTAPAVVFTTLAFGQPSLQLPQFAGFTPPAFSQPAFSQFSLDIPSFTAPSFSEPAFTAPTFANPFGRSSQATPAVTQSAFSAPKFGGFSQATPAFTEPAFSQPTFDLSRRQFTIPEFSAPAFSAPAFSAPAFSAPAFSAPAFSAPAFSQRSLEIPSFTVPAFSEPAFTAPSFSQPTFDRSKRQFPGFSAPAFSAPAFSQFSLNIPSFTAPAFSEPSFALPTFADPFGSTPAFSIPAATQTATRSSSLSSTESVPTLGATGLEARQACTSGSDLSNELQFIVKDIENLLGALPSLASSTDILSSLNTTALQLQGLTSTYGKDKSCPDPWVASAVITGLEALVGQVGSLLLGLTQLLNMDVFHPSQRHPLGGLAKDTFQGVTAVAGLVTQLVPDLTSLPNLKEAVESELSGLVGGILIIL